MATVETLAKERATFERNKPALLPESEGKYALIHGDQVVGVWETYGEALEAGYDQFDLAPFMVKRIEQEEKVSWGGAFHADNSINNTPWRADRRQCRVAT